MFTSSWQCGFSRGHGLRVLSQIKHDDQTLAGDIPSWVPFCWGVEDVLNTLGIYTGFYYDASVGAEPCVPTLVSVYHLEVRGTIVDVVTEAYSFSDPELADPSAQLLLKEELWTASGRTYVTLEGLALTLRKNA